MIQMKWSRYLRVFFLQMFVICHIKGFSLYPASDLTVQSFTLVCDLEGATWTDPISFTYNGNPGCVCGSPPNPSCTSPIGTTVINSGMVNFTLNQNEIQSKGNSLWVCTHGTASRSYNATVIALCMTGKVTYDDKKIAISCSCGFPSVQADVLYKGSSNGQVLGNQTFDLGPSQLASCTTDNRAMNFAANIENYPSETEEVCVTIKTYLQKTTPGETVCAGCTFSAVVRFFGGFSCFLIVLITSIIIMIILACRILPNIFGDLSTNQKKIFIIGGFILVALIIGLILGFRLNKCNQRNLGLGLGLGLGFGLAVALVVTLYVYKRMSDSTRENEDENRKPEDNPQRVGSPASASNIKMESKNKTDVLKGDQSALKQKVLHSPLPLPPVDSQPPKASDDKLSRKKLDPIAVGNEVAEKKKKKKKKKKKRAVDEAGDNENEN